MPSTCVALDFLHWLVISGLWLHIIEHVCHSMFVFIFHMRNVEHQVLQTKYKLGVEKNCIGFV